MFEKGEPYVQSVLHSAMLLAYGFYPSRSNVSVAFYQVLSAIPQFDALILKHNHLQPLSYEGGTPSVEGSLLQPIPLILASTEDCHT